MDFENHRCREIIARAVYGRGQRHFCQAHNLFPPYRPEGILGLWVTNHCATAVARNNVVEVQGHYDINVWYSHHGHTLTDVLKTTVPYCVTVPIRETYGERMGSEQEVRLIVTRYPHATEAAIQEIDGRTGIHVVVEKEFYVEIVADTKLCVQVCPEDLCFPTPVEDIQEIPEEYIEEGLCEEEKKKDMFDVPEMTEAESEGVDTE